MEPKNKRPCAPASTLIFACSGAADVGALVDSAARRLSSSGAGKMYCLAGIGGNVKAILDATQSADTLLAIDGCPLDCTRLSLEHAGFSGFKWLRATDLGIKKGEAPLSEKNIQAVVQAALSELTS